MWTATRRSIPENRGETIALAVDGRSLSVGEGVDGWHEDQGFRDLFIAELAASPYSAFFWEMPPVSRDELSKPFECAMIASEALAHMRADESDFAEHLLAATASVASFRNLGGDALLIAPTKISGTDCYAHFAGFLRDGPREQQHALFQLLA